MKLPRPLKRRLKAIKKQNESDTKPIPNPKYQTHNVTLPQCNKSSLLTRKTGVMVDVIRNNSKSTI